MKKNMIILGLLIILITAQPLGTQIIKPPKKEALSHKDATIKQLKENKKLAKKIAWVGYGWKGKDWVCIHNIIMKESRYDHLSKNKHSSAFGIGQRLTESSKDPTTQLLTIYKYIIHRYETPCNGWKFHQRHNYF